MRSTTIEEEGLLPPSQHHEAQNPLTTTFARYYECIISRLNLILIQNDRLAFRLKGVLDRNGCSVEQLVYCMLDTPRLAAVIAKIERSALTEGKLPHLIRLLREEMYKLCIATEQDVIPQNSPIFPESQSPCERPLQGTSQPFRVIWPD